MDARPPRARPGEDRCWRHLPGAPMCGEGRAMNLASRPRALSPSLVEARPQSGQRAGTNGGKPRSTLIRNQRIVESSAGTVISRRRVPTTHDASNGRQGYGSDGDVPPTTRISFPVRPSGPVDETAVRDRTRRGRFRYRPCRAPLRRRWVERSRSRGARRACPSRPCLPAGSVRRPPRRSSGFRSATCSSSLLEKWKVGRGSSAVARPRSGNRGLG